MNLMDYSGAGGAAAGMALGGPLGALGGAIAGDFLGDLFGGSSEDKAAEAHKRRMAEVARQIAADRQRQMAGRFAMTQNAGQAFAPANQMFSGMTGGRMPGVDLGKVFAPPVDLGQQPPQQSYAGPADTPEGQASLRAAGQKANSKLGPLGSILPNPFG